MITGVCFLTIVATVPLFGGRLSRLATVRLGGGRQLLAAIAIQVVVLFAFATRLPHEIAAALHLISYGFALGFAWSNRRVPWIGLLVVGGLMNLAAIAANGGVMPASAEALEVVGIDLDDEAFRNSAVVEGARLAILGDIFATPAGIPFANVFSIGDVLLVLGGGLTVHTICGSRLRRPSARRAIASRS